MLRTVVLAAALTAPAFAQISGRLMLVPGPPVLGETATFGMLYPVGASGNPYAFLWSMPPFAGTQTLSVPGFTVRGLLRVSPTNSVAAYTGVLGSSGVVAHSLVVPSHPSFLGMSWDLQTVDLELRSSVVSLADDDLTLVVSDTLPPHLNMIPIVPGTFQMGSVAAGATPVNTVTMLHRFWMGRDEVTQAEYQAVMGNNPSYFQGASWPNAAQRPVEQVTWHNAVAYCDALSVREAAAGRLPSGYEYRLPTEAEWEYCCRAGTTTEWNVGTSLNCSQANFHNVGYCVPPGQTSVVGSYAPNAWGLRDMHGNVSEWCLDGYIGYPSVPVTDHYVMSFTSSTRVFRGGGWHALSMFCRSAVRGSLSPSGSNSGLGFRVVCGRILQ